jgi:hypothetical protein
MTSNNQVSPVIRISRGERDASARATHLKAASKKYLETTIERKQMSTTTNFKRIALVAVAALGLGLLSSVPSNAAITGTIAVTNTNGTATTALADSTTAGSIQVRWLATVATDSVSITTALNTKPTGSNSPTLNFYPTDTLTSFSSAVLFPVTRSVANLNDTAVVTGSGAAGYIAGKFGYQLSELPTRAGTYTYTLTITPFTSQAAESTKVVTQDVSIVVTAPASASLIASAANSRARLVTGTTVDSETAESLSVSLDATAQAGARASVWVKLVNAANVATAVEDSLTVTIDKGNIGTANNAALGKNVIIDYKPAASAGGLAFFVFSDGTTGPATITIATKNAGTFTKTLNWFGTAASAKATVVSSVIGSTGTGVILGTEADGAGVDLGAATSLFAYSSDTTVISNFGTACGSYDATLKGVLCDLAGVKSGTANITLRDASTVALSKFASNAVAVRVSIGEVATSATITFNKSSYAPNERVTAIVRVLDAKGLTMPAGTYTNVFAAGGITTSSQLNWAAGESLTATSVTTAGNSSATTTAPVVSTEPIAQYTYFAPATGGNVVFTTKGGTGLALAGQVAITGTATVTDSGAAALAAVTALATTVASLRTLIVTLTNLVLKIQKKVRA